MNELDESFRKLLGRQPNDKERQDLYRVRDALELKNNDALWLILMALQYYQDQYDQFPKLIAQTAKSTLDNFKTTADASVRASVEAAKADMAKTIAEIGQKVADSTAHKKRAQWISGSVIACIFCLTLFGWYMHNNGRKSGYKAGYADGYIEAKDEKAAATWANTPEGKIAYRFAQVESIRDLAECKGFGWERKNGFCFVKKAVDGNIYGWKLP